MSLAKRSPIAMIVLGAILLLVGIGGLWLGMQRYPDSNLLGGFALVFGPIFWVGAVTLPFGLVRWLDKLSRRQHIGRGH